MTPPRPWTESNLVVGTGHFLLWVMDFISPKMSIQRASRETPLFLDDFVCLGKSRRRCIMITINFGFILGLMDYCNAVENHFPINVKFLLFP